MNASSLAAIASALVCFSMAGTGAEFAFAQDPGELVVAAIQAGAAGSETGDVRGSRKFFQNGALSASMDFHLRFAGEKYNVHIHNHKVGGRSPQFEKHICVYDGSAIFVNTFSPRIIPAGCSARIIGEDMPLAPYTSGFAWVPADSHEIIIGMEALERYEVDFQFLPNGDIRGTYEPLQGVVTVFEASAAHGYNVVRMEYGTKNRFILTADWTNHGGVWFLSRFAEKLIRSDGGAERTELAFENVALNQPVSPELFTLAALELCEGSRILDARPGALILSYTVPEPTTEERLGTIAEQVRTFPVRSVRQAPLHQPDGR